MATPSWIATTADQHPSSEDVRIWDFDESRQYCRHLDMGSMPMRVPAWQLKDESFVRTHIRVPARTGEALEYCKDLYDRIIEHAAVENVYILMQEAKVMRDLQGAEAEAADEHKLDTESTDEDSLALTEEEQAEFDKIMAEVNARLNAATHSLPACNEAQIKHHAQSWAMLGSDVAF